MSCLIENPLQVCSLPAQSRAVVNDLAVELASRAVDESHLQYRTLLALCAKRPKSFSILCLGGAARPYETNLLSGGKRP